MVNNTALSPRRLDRFLQIDELLRRRCRVTQSMLAEQLEVTERTIRDDLNFLRDRFSAPLVYSKKDGWYYTDSTWRLPSITLSNGELFALTLGARMLQSYAGAAYEPELRSAIERLSERLPEKTCIDLQQLADERIVFRSGVEINLDPDIWQKLLEACRSFKKIWIYYYTASRNQYSERVVNPYLLHVYRATNPYVIGFCHKREQIRWFRVDRIQQIKVLDEVFEPDPNFDPQTYLDQIFQAEVGGDPVPVAIWFDKHNAPFIRERRWHVTQEITEHDDGSLTLHLMSGGLNDLKRWVLGYGRGAVVKKPTELVNLVKAEVEGMYQHYQLSEN